MDGKQEIKIGERAKYLNKLNRNEASVIFRARTRMLNVKSNYKNAHKNLKCRMCNKHEETQMHILEECEELNEIPRITKEMIFNEGITELKLMLNNLNKRMTKVENTEPNSTSLSKTDASDNGRCAQ